MKAVVLASLAALSFSLAPTQAEELVRIERQQLEDAAILVGQEIPVVLELQSGLFATLDASQRERLEQIKRHAVRIDAGSEGWDYLLVPLTQHRPLETLGAFGVVVWVEENLAFLRVHRNLPLPAELEPGCFGTTRLRRAPLEAPRLDRAASRRQQDGATPDPLVQQIVSRVDNAQIQTVWQDITSNPPHGTRYTTSAGCDAASQYCFNRYSNLGYAPQFHEWNADHAPNVVAEIPGATHPERIYILVGHLDDLPSSGTAPGADDNGSGTVTVLEGARVMNCHSYRNTVRFLNVTGEELGLLGSDVYAAEARQRGDDIRGVLNFDMNGWEGDGTPSPENIDVSYNAFSQWLGELYAQNATTYGTGLVVDAFLCPSLTASDHASFWSRGYPAIIGITDNHNYCGHAGTYPDYHESTDTIAANGNPALFQASIRTAVATLAELAQPFVITFHRDRYACGATIEVVVSDPGRNLNSSQVESFSLTVTSGSEPAGESITLTERGTNSKLFSGSITLTNASPVTADGLLTALEGDQLAAQYVDALDCGGNANAAYQAAATVDCSGPAISGVAESSVTGTTATIVWNTDERSSSEVVWGPTLPPGTTTTGASDVTSHAVNLSGLSECTVYHYQVRSTDAPGNTAIADNGGQYFHFETLGDFGEGLQPCHAGRVTIQQPVWSCHDSVRFQVVDLDLNRNPNSVETVLVEVISSSEADPEWVTLTESGPNTSRFEGQIATSVGAPTRDGVLQSAHGDTITVTYRDADDGTGAPRIDFELAQVDCAGPAISNLRVEAITDARATVRFTTDEPASVTVEWGTTPALGQSVSVATTATDHAVVLNRLNGCSPGYIRVRATDSYGQATIADDLGEPHRFQSAMIPGLYWKDDFESGTTAWTLNGEWQVGTPQGQGGSSGLPDPTAAYNKDRVLGHDLSGLGTRTGDYEANRNEAALSPVLPATTWQNTKLLIYKRLNVGASDDASIWLQATQGYPLYRSSGTTVLDNDYAVMTFSIGGIADGKPAVQLQVRQQSDGSGHYSGWNIDDVIFKNGALPDYAPCGGCSAPPSFVGVESARDRNGCAGDGIELRWQAAAAWGTGASGSYAIYRNTTAPFTPNASNRIAAGITSTSYIDTTPPADQSVHYIVRAENNETCSAGPANGGVVDDNALALAATDWTARPTPGSITDLRVERIAGAHLRLDWSATAGSASYRVERSLVPQPSGFAQISQLPALRYDDLGAGADLQDYFYLVRGVNECSIAGP